jgi:hypothetical protein
VQPPFYGKIDLFQYADFVQQWWWIADGLGVDFTDCTASFALRVSPSDAAPLLAVSTTATSSGSILLGTNAGNTAGLVQLNIDASVITPLVARVAHGDLLITMSNGEVVEFGHLDAIVHAGNTY